MKKKLLTLALCFCTLLGLFCGAAADDLPKDMTAVILTENLSVRLDAYPQLAALATEYRSAGADVVLVDRDGVDWSAAEAEGFGGAMIALKAAIGYAETDEYPELCTLADVTLYVFEGEELLLSTPYEFDEASPVDEAVAKMVADMKKDTPVIFADVPVDADYFDALEFVVDSGLMKGTGLCRFEPDAPMTRATFATVLYRHAGCPEVDFPTTFVDAKEDWYVDAIAWAQRSGAIYGYDINTFGVDDPVTRQDAATILWRFAGKPTDIRADFSFADKDEIDDYARFAVTWAYENGILDTAADGRIQPKREATRAELAQLLARYDAVIGE